MAGLWLIAGLGNPGARYERTRHNAGFWFVQALANGHGAELRLDRKLGGRSARVRAPGLDLILLAPETFMNHSGQSVRAAVDYYGVDRQNLLIAHDELDLPPGAARLKRDGGHGGHNGLRSLFQHLGSPDFWRLRIGIGHPGTAEEVTPWVLSRAPAADEQAIRAAIERAVAVMPEFLSGRAGEAMKVLHARARPEPEPEPEPQTRTSGP